MGENITIRSGRPNHAHRRDRSRLHRALASRLQLAGDTVAILRAVDARVAQYELAFQALVAQRRAAGDPEPLRTNPYRVWQVLLLVARAANVGLPLEPRDVYLAGLGHGFEQPEPGMSVEAAMDRFLSPQPPREPEERIGALERPLEELHRHAYAEHERQQAEAKEQAEAARDADRRRAQRHAEMRAAELERAVQAKLLEDAARERQAKIAEVVEAAARARASAATAR
jgi:hypothetical protein